VTDCARCGGTGPLVCKTHDDRPEQHDGCDGAGLPCPGCNVGDPPRLDGWTSFVDSLRIASPSTRAPELLFEFLRAADRRVLAAWLKFRGESYGYEIHLMEGGELFAARGGFVTRALAIAWAHAERKAMQR
jgi:hypothetical protein